MEDDTFGKRGFIVMTGEQFEAYKNRRVILNEHWMDACTEKNNSQADPDFCGPV